MDFKYLFEDSRARVYLLWAAIVGTGYTTTHYYQNKNINFVWFVLACIGFIYMYKVMPLRVTQMKQIYLAWLMPLSIGLAVSILAVRTDLFPGLIAYLGSFWLMVQAVGFMWNGIFDPLSKWYFIAAAVNVLAAGACYFVDVFNASQYLIAAIVSVWSMLCLWAFRSDAY